MEIDQLRRMITNHNAQIRRRVPEGVSGAGTAFVSARARAMSSSLSLDDGAKALAAAHASLAELARQATGSERRRYSGLMDIVLAELKVVTQKILDRQGGAYVPLTSQLRAATAELRQAYQRAQQKISDLNNAAALLTAFGALISALR
jgi:hypothetical protein